MRKFGHKMPRGPNPATLDKELVGRLCLKSLIISKSKWKWRKLCAKAKCSAEELEQRFDTVINNLKKKGQDEQQQSNKQLGNDAGSNRADGSGEEGTPESDTGRSGETNDESNSIGSVE